MESKKSPAPSQPKHGHRATLLSVLRLGSVMLLITLGCFALTAFIFSHWVERQILTTSNWVATVGPLPQQPQVTSALSNYVTAQVFNNVPISREIANALPPKASFLAGPLASQLQNVANKVSYQVIGSDTFTNIWVAANRAAMDQLVGAARGQRPPLGSRLASFSLNINGIKSQIASKLGTTASALPSLQGSSGNLVNVRTSLKAKREQVWGAIRATDFTAAVMPYVAAACLLGALALAKDRLKAVLAISIVMIVLMLISIISLKVLRQDILGQVKNASYQPAVGYLYDTLTNSLRSLLIYGGIVVWAVIFCLALLLSPYRWAIHLRSILHLPRRVLYVDDQGWWQSFRHSIRQYQYYIEGGIAILLLFWLAFIANVNGKIVLNGVLAAISFVAIVYLLAHPHKAGRLLS